MRPAARGVLFSCLGLWLGGCQGASAPEPPPPRLWTLAPPDGARGVEPDASVTLRFSAPMDCTSLAGGGLVVSSADGAVVGRLDCQLSSVTFRPSQALALATRYSVAVGAGARGVDGLALARATTAGFTTRSRAVASVSPPDLATEVEARPLVSVTFRDPVACEEVDAGVGSAAGPAPGDWSCDGGSGTAVLTFTPTFELEPGTTYGVTVTATGPDAGPVPLEPFRSTFTTRAWPPHVEATVRSFPAGRAPPGLPLVEVVVAASSGGWSIADAGVDLNGVPLAYEPLTRRYLGDLALAPGQPVALRVATATGTVTAGGAQLATLPSITAPAPGTRWSAGCDLPVTWSGGALGAGQLGLLLLVNSAHPAATPAEAWAWPEHHATASLSSGEWFLAAGASAYLPVDGGTGWLRLCELDAVPVVGEQPSLLALELDPPDAGLAPEGTLALRALGQYCGRSVTVTELATFASSDPGVATVSDARGSRGRVTAVAAGTAVITATLDGLTASATLAVTLDGGAP